MSEIGDPRNLLHRLCLWSQLCSSVLGVGIMCARNELQSVREFMSGHGDHDGGRPLIHDEAARQVTL